MKFSLQRGFTALILASLHGNFAAVKLLLQMRAEGNTQTNVSWTFRTHWLGIATAHSIASIIWLSLTSILGLRE